MEQLLIGMRAFDFPIGQQLYKSVVKRVKERRSEVLASIARYLDNPSGYVSARTKSPLDYLTKTAVVNESIKLMKRLYGLEDDSSDSSEDEVEPLVPKPLNFQEKLKQVLSKVGVEKKKKVKIGKRNLKRDFDMYEDSGEPTSWIIKLKNLMLSIKPSSTEPERTFSIAGKFITKIRASLSSKTVNALVFLKNWYQGKK